MIADSKSAVRFWGRKKGVAMGDSGGRGVQSRRGTTVREIVEDHASAIRLAKKAAEKLRQQSPGIVVSWRETLRLPMPDQIVVKGDKGSSIEQDPQAIRLAEEMAAQINLEFPDDEPVQGLDLLRSDPSRKD